MTGTQFINMIEKMCGRFRVIKFAFFKQYPSTKNIAYWHCRCKCGNEKDVDGRNLRNGTTQSCGCLNKEINSKKMKGIPFTKDHKDNISKALKGRIFSKEWWQKISEAGIGRSAGEKNPNWRGGISGKPYSFNFISELREKIRERDNYQCQICAKKEESLIGYDRKLPVHHIDYDKTNDNSENLITLCHSCHSKTSFNREYWKYYFQHFYQGGENLTSLYAG